MTGFNFWTVKTAMLRKAWRAIGKLWKLASSGAKIESDIFEKTNAYFHDLKMGASTKADLILTITFRDKHIKNSWRMV